MRAWLLWLVVDKPDEAIKRELSYRSGSIPGLVDRGRRLIHKAARDGIITKAEMLHWLRQTKVRQ